jgi:hypothetical protein
LLIQPANTFLSSAHPANATANSINSTGSFLVQIPGNSAQDTFVPAIQFTPSGQVRNGSSPIDVIDFDLQPQKGTVADANNVAVFRLNGLTGEGVVYRQ